MSQYAAERPPSGEHTRCAAILAAVTRELDQRQRHVEAERALSSVRFHVKFDLRTGKVRSVAMSVDTEQEWRDNGRSEKEVP